MPHDVFISYPSEDKPTADAVCAALEARSIRCWIAPRDVLPGQEYAEAIINALEGASLLVLVFSSHANVSPHISREVERAVKKGIPIIPFRIEAVEPARSLAYFLSTPHWLDALTPPLERHLDYLGQTVEFLLHGGNPPALLADSKPPAKEGVRLEPKLVLGAVAVVALAVLVVAVFALRNGPSADGSRISERASYAGNCSTRPSGTTCINYSDGFIWLVKDSIVGWAKAGSYQGHTVEVAQGSLADYHHVLSTNYVWLTPK